MYCCPSLGNHPPCQILLYRPAWFSDSSSSSSLPNTLSLGILNLNLNQSSSKTRCRLTVTMASDGSVTMATDSSASRSSDCNADADAGSAASDYTEIVVVRHGETKWNADHRIQGHLDVELNEVGREQAAAVADRLSKERKISAVYASDLKRALVTAQIIAGCYGGLEVVQDMNLRERHLGDLQGQVLQEAAKLKPHAYQAFVSRTRNQTIPGGGESLDQLYQRCTSVVQKIGGNHKGERIVVVTHGGVIRQLYQRAIPKGKSPGKIENASVNIFQLSGDGDWTITTWGDVSHLEDTSYLESAFGGDENSG